MKKVALLIMFVGIVSGLFSQLVVENHYGISQNYSLKGVAICNTNDGNYLVLCQGDSLEVYWESTIEPVFLIKITPQGDSIWTKQIVVNQMEILYDMEETQDGGFIILADTYQDQMVLLKVDQDGEELWQKTISGSTGGLFPKSIANLNDGGLIITGTHNGHFAFLMKTNANGEQLWFQDAYSPTHLTFGYGVVQDANGDIYFCGHYSPNETAWNHEIYLVKTDNSGNKIWDKIISGASGSGDPDYSNDLIITNDNQIAITGKSFVSGYGYITYIAKFDTQGDMVFHNNIYTGEISGIDIKQTPLGNYFIAGRGDNGDVSHEFNAIKLDPDGNVIWTDYYAWEPPNYFAMGQANEIEIIGEDSYMAIGWMHHDEAINVAGNWMCATHLFIVTPEIETGTVRNLTGTNSLVYPNPARDIVNVKVSFAIKSIQVLNSVGQVVFIDNVNDRFYQFKVSAFEKGIYFIKIETDEGKHLIKKISVI